jgi:hypothetical protein
MMDVRDKWICATLVLIVSLTGCTFYGFAHNDTTTTTPTQIVVNGNGSSGTGDVQNVQQVTQVTQVASGSSGSSNGSGVTTKQVATGTLTGQSYEPT